MKDYAVIQALNMSDAYLQNIAAELGVHSKTVSGALRRGSAPSRLERRRGGKLDAHEATVDRLRL
jgi:DNA-binding MarR family transcriptional regulator